MNHRRLIGGVCALVLAGTALAAPALGKPTTSGTRDSAAVSSAKSKSFSKADLRKAQRQATETQKQLEELRQRQREADRAVKKSKATLGVLAREQYASGSSDIAGLALIIGSDDPREAMRDASLLSDFEADRQADWVATERSLEQAEAQSESAAAAASKAQRKLLAAFQGVLNAQPAGSRSDGPGSAKLNQRCLNAKSVSPICIHPAWTEKNQTVDAVLAGRYVNIRWPQIKDVGGWRPFDAYPDHPTGRAIDVMMPNRGGGSDAKLGNEIAAYFQKHAADYGIHYMIWRQQMWKSSNKPGAWTGMTNRGSATANHFDHIHISFTDGKSAKILPELLEMTQLPR